MAKLFRNYNTLSQFNDESIHQENKICFIKDKGIIYSNGVQYSHSKMHIISDIGDSDSIVDKFNELRKGLLESNLMTARTPHTVIYWAGDSNTIKINGSKYTAEPDKININGVEYYQLTLDKDLDNNFYKFSNNIFTNNNTFTNLIFKDVDTSKVTNMNKMFHYCRSITYLDVSKFDTSKVTNMSWMFGYCSSLTSLNVSGWNTSKVTNMSSMFHNCSALKTIKMVGCSQTTIDKIKAQLSKDRITGCTIITE